MSSQSRPLTYFHLHLVSDATGETLNAVAKAACAQFTNVKPIEHIYALVRSPRQLNRALSEIENAPGLIFFTLVNDDLRTQMERRCAEFGMPCLSIMDPILTTLGNYLGTELSHKAGGQHEMNADYFNRIDALNFTMAHDDGQSGETLNDADVIILGVSRTSKTPTCIYLANRGVKAANIPLVKDIPLPVDLDKLTKPLIIGLTASPSRLLQIRRNRLLSLNVESESDYIDADEIKKEVVFARKLYESKNWPIVDVSRRSIEETAAAILNYFSRWQLENNGN